MYCFQCGAELNGAIFCPVCGAPVKGALSDDQARSPERDASSSDNPYATNNDSSRAKNEYFYDFLLPNFIMIPISAFACYGSGGLGVAVPLIGVSFAFMSRQSRAKGNLDEARSCATVAKVLFWLSFIVGTPLAFVMAILYEYGSV